jgi:probable rRNA maturation factor
MMDVNNFTRFAVDVKYLESIAEKILAGEKKEKEELSVSFVKPSEIRKLNKKYRKIDKPTDVLSFTYEGSGEIVICPAVVKGNAKKYGINFESELKKVFIHGILHILGYDHEKDEKNAREMEEKTDYYLNIF